MKSVIPAALVLVIILLSVAMTAGATPLIGIRGQEPRYEVWGEELQGVGAVDIAVGYDAASLKNPRVTQLQLAGGAMMFPKLSNPGEVRVVLVAPQGITGSGGLLQIVFDALGGSSEKITSLSVISMVSAASKQEIPVQKLIAVTPSPVTVPADVKPTPEPASNLTDSGSGQVVAPTIPVTNDTPPTGGGGGTAAAADSPPPAGTTTGQSAASRSSAGETGPLPVTGGSGSSGGPIVVVATVPRTSGAVGSSPAGGESRPQGVEAAASRSTAGEEPVPEGHEPPASASEPPVAPPERHIAPETAPQDEPAALPGTETADARVTATLRSEAQNRVEPKGAVSPDVKTDAQPAKGVVALFREYRGARTPEALTALFVRGALPGVSQTPPIAIADGVAAVTLTMDQIASPSPNFSVSGGRLASLKKDGSRYAVTVVPDVRAFEVSVSLLVRGSVTTIPLTVVPPLDRKSLPGGRLDEAAFALLLKGAGTAAVDVNRDGTRDYRDDYILTGHYLLTKNRK